MSTPAIATSNNAGSAKVSDLIIVLLVGLGAVGLAPVALFLGRPELVLYFAVGATIIAYLSGRGRVNEEVQRAPSLVAGLYATVGSVSLWAFVGFIWIPFYQGLYFLIKLFSEPPLAASIAYYVTLSVSIILALGVVTVCTQNISRQLYTGEVPAALRGPGTARSQLMLLILNLTVLSAVALMLWLVRGRDTWWIYLMIQSLPYVVGAQVLTLKTRLEGDADVVDAVGKLLVASGYQVLRSPRTYDESIDSLLVNVDMLADSDGQTLAINVKTPNIGSGPVEWTVASGLCMKAKAMDTAEVRKKLGLRSPSEKRVKPLLVLCGRKPAESLLEFSKDEAFPIVILDRSVVATVLTSSDQNALAVLAHSYFDSVESPTITSESAPNSAGGR